MFVVQPIGYRHRLLVPTILTRLISADQQNCSASRIEGEKDTVGSSSVLNAQFLHVGVLRGRYGVHMGPAERRPEAAKQVYLRPYVHLFGFAQTSHHAPNSFVNSTSHSSKGIYLQKPSASMVVGDSGSVVRQN